jgi:dTDP-4-amino-4,6-dideoxygalactose transaminase
MTEMPNNVLLNDFVSQWDQIRDRALAAVNRVGESGWLILGQEVAQFEKSLSEWIQVKHVVGCANGLDAIEIGLRCLGLKPGGRVLTTPLSAFATSLAIIRAGGVPVFVDVDRSGLLDLDLCDRFLSENNDVKFLVPVHLFGHALDLNRLEALQKKHSLKVVEDCAQAIGAKSDGRVIGSVGQVSATSFYPTKNLGCMGDGGAVFTNDDTIAQDARIMRDYGQAKKYSHETLGLNSRLDELHAAVLKDALLPHLLEGTKKRKQIASRYLQEIKNPKINFSAIPSASDSVWHLFPVLVKGDRASFQSHLTKHKIQNAIHYPILITDQKALKDLPHAVYPVAKSFADTEVSLPIHPYLSEDEVTRVIQAVNSWAE